jgi:hypothetical protein
VAPNITYERHKVYGQSGATKKRLLFLGDSFMALDHVGRDCFLSVAKALQQDRLAVVNAAIPNTGPFDYLSQMKTLYDRQNFDGTYLFFYVGNDLTDTISHNMYRSSISTGLKSYFRDTVRGLYVYHFYLQKMNQLRWGRRTEASPMRVEGVDPRLLKLHQEGKVRDHHLWTALHNTQPNFHLDNLLLDSDESRQGWRRVEDLLDRMLEASKSRGIPFSIVMFPAALQVAKAHFAFAKMLGMNTSEETLIGNEPQRRLTEYCASRGIACWDLLAEFRANSDKQLYLAYDDHLSPAGNDLAAQLISEFIRRREK